MHLKSCCTEHLIEVPRSCVKQHIIRNLLCKWFVLLHGEKSSWEWIGGHTAAREMAAHCEMQEWVFSLLGWRGEVYFLQSLQETHKPQTLMVLPKFRELQAFPELQQMCLMSHHQPGEITQHLANLLLLFCSASFPKRNIWRTGGMQAWTRVSHHPALLRAE